MTEVSSQALAPAIGRKSRGLPDDRRRFYYVSLRAT
jgi:hypothetical protein